jgi:putative PIN family toxin of toxin-antitoxin system
MRIVLDTNVVLTMFGRHSEQRWILDALMQGKFTLLVTTEIMFEYQEILLRRQKTSIAQLAVILLARLPNVVAVEPHFYWNLIHADPDDNKFVDCAIAGNADAIVSEDAHFDALKNIPFPTVKVLSVAEFAALLGIEIA